MRGDGTFEAWNHHAARLLRIDEGELSTLSVGDLVRERSRSRAVERLKAARLGEDVVETVVLPRKGSGSAPAALEVRARRLDDDRVLAILRDVSELRRHLRTMRILSSALAETSHPRFLPNLCGALVRALPIDYGFVGELVDARTGRVQLYGFEGPSGTLEPLAYDLEGTPCGVAVETGQPVFTSRLQEDFPRDEMLIDLGIRTYHAIPLMDAKEGCIGILGTLCNDSVDRDEQVDLTLNLVAGRVSSEIRMVRSERSRRRLQLQLREALRDSSRVAWGAEEPTRRSGSTDASSEARSEAWALPGGPDADITPDDALTRLFESIPVPASMATASGRFTAINDAFAQETGYGPEAVVGSTPTELGLWANTEEKPRIVDALRGGQWSGEVTIRTAAGDLKQVAATLRCVEWDGAQHLLGAYVDVTERRAAETLAEARRDQVRELLRRLLRAQEDERSRISAELHDQIGQAMTAIQLNHAAMLASRSSEDERRGLVFETMAVVDDVMHQLRSLSFELRPAMLEELGLHSALSALIPRKLQHADVQIDLDFPELDVEPEPALACFRIAQEAVTNIVRHASATHVRGALRADGDHFSFTLVDDGEGFDSDGRRDEPCMGMEIMMERAKAAGGTVSVDSRPGEGTRVSVRLPRKAPT